MIGGEVGGLASVDLQCILVHVPSREKQLSVCEVLQERQILVWSELDCVVLMCPALNSPVK